MSIAANSLSPPEAKCSVRSASRHVIRSSRAITLIEVVVGLFLLGTLLTMILIASGKLERQRRVALSKIQAVEQLDQLVSEYFGKGSRPTISTNH